MLSFARNLLFWFILMRVCEVSPMGAWIRRSHHIHTPKMQARALSPHLSQPIMARGLGLLLLVAVAFSTATRSRAFLALPSTATWGGQAGRRLAGARAGGVTTMAYAAEDASANAGSSGKASSSQPR